MFIYIYIYTYPSLCNPMLPRSQAPWGLSSNWRAGAACGACRLCLYYVRMHACMYMCMYHAHIYNIIYVYINIYVDYCLVLLPWYDG